MYIPKPIDTSMINLPRELENLVEILAENNHDNWAQQRINEGWTFGEKRNDENKKHPDLISYKDLTESEKEYDRITATEALKLIIKLNWKITK